MWKMLYFMNVSMEPIKIIHPFWFRLKHGGSVTAGHLWLELADLLFTDDVSADGSRK